MSELLEKIKTKLKETKKTFISFEELSKIINHLEGEYDVDEIVKDLEQSGIIYYRNDVFSLFPDNTKVGTIECSRNRKLFILLENNDKIYFDENELNGALAYDKVVYSVDENDQAKVVAILERHVDNILCEVQDTFGVLSVVPKNIQGRLNIKVNQETLKQIGNGNYVLVKVGIEKNKGFYSGEVVKKIALNGEVDSALALVAYSNDFEVEFNENVLDEAKRIPTAVSAKEIEERKENDFRDKIVFTIDGVDTKDMDDAISLEILPNGNYELGVHIANVSHYVKKGSAIFEEAKNRSTSLYMLNTVIPMLPEILSNGICSLNENVDRLTKSVIMEINSEGKVVNSKIVDGVIKSSKKMSYDDVNRIIENNEIPEGYENFATTLKQMNKLSKILSARRENQGKINFASSELKINLDDDGNPLSIKPREGLSAETLIENFMVLANETVASYVYWMEMPFIYRVHEGPNKYKLDDALRILSSIGYKLKNKEILSNPKMIQKLLILLKDEEEYPVLSDILLRCMARAKYSSDNEGHFALASEAYTHFTSPIRRFPDLMIHTLLDYYNDYINGKVEITNESLDELEQSLEAICEHSSRRERQADTAEYQADRLKIIAYMRERVGETFDATISMINEKAISITTSDGIYGTVFYNNILGDTFQFSAKKYTAIGRYTKAKYKIGNHVEVTLIKVNELTGTLIFSLDQNLSRKPRASENTKVSDNAKVLIKK